MITPIAKKYANALMKSADKDIDNISDALEKISLAYNIKKTEYILNSFVDKQKIVNLLIDISDNSSKILSNFLNVLESRKRLSLLPQISHALSLSVADKNNKYIGYVYSKEDIKQNTLLVLEKNISKKFNKDISLVYIKNNFEGICLDIEMLNMQISFSKNQIKNRLLDNILKSI
ncbi:ATP synthase delta chain [hydrothermal vent metagenome]|uniref:ATP synthase delta chain n=1 Tax=hydrothermal vent metagenome TaxID=652676 RepID=A0A3B1E6J0_9ZZZZ